MKKKFRRFLRSLYGYYNFFKSICLKFLWRLEVKLLEKFPVIDRCVFSFSKRKLENLMKSEKTLDDIINTCKKYRGFLIYKHITLHQIPSEIKELLNILRNRRVSSILEIGTGDGGSAYVFLRYLNCKTFISIDLPGKYPQKKKKLFKLFNPYAKSYFLRIDSHSKEAVRKVREILGRGKVDFLFIDGDHSYDGVKLDFEMYRKFVKRGGFVAFHDIIHPKLGVIKFWREIKCRYPFKEIIAPRYEMLLNTKKLFDKDGWGGIGLLRV